MKSDNRPKRIAIVGTDTDVGKTVLSLFVMRFFTEKGYAPFYLKPFQTGCRTPYDDDSDARFIYENMDSLKDKDPAESVLSCFHNPKAPWFAARDQGKTAKISDVLDAVEEKGRDHAPLIIETAGGVLVPINREEIMIDLVERCMAVPVIAARAGLGTINHTLLTVAALRARGIAPAGIVLLDGGQTPTSPAMIAENIEAIEAGSGLSVGGVIGRIEDFSNPDPEILAPVSALFPDI